MRFHLFIAAVLLLPIINGQAQTPLAPPRTVHDIIAILDSYPVDRTKLDAARKVLDTPLSAELGNVELADFHHKRARAAGELGLVSPQLDELRKAIALGGGTESWRILQELSSAEYLAGNFRAAIEARKKAQVIVMGSWLTGAVAGNHLNLSAFYMQLGDFDGARRELGYADNILADLRRSNWWQAMEARWLLENHTGHGRMEEWAGHYLKAEAHFRRALDYAERDIPASLTRLRDKVPGAPPHHRIELARDSAEGRLANILRKQGRLREAEVHARNALRSAIEHTGHDGLYSNVALLSLISVLVEEQRSAEALLLIDRGIRNLEKLGVPATAISYVKYRRYRATALTAQRQWQAAVSEFEAIQNSLASDPQLADAIGAPNLDWIRALLATNKADAALELSDKLSRQLREHMGPKAYDAAEALGFHGAALAAAGRNAEAFDALRAALGVLIPIAAEASDRSGRRFQRLSFTIENYLTVLVRLRGTPLEKAKGIDAAAEAFLVADALRGQSLQQAMSASSARASAGSPELANLAREEQDARQERDALYRILADLMSRPSDQVLPQVIANMRKRADELGGILLARQETIRNRFPEYADLVSPRPASVEKIQAVLRPGEALLSILPSETRTFVWAVPAKGPIAFAETPIGREEITPMVDRLRKALDPGELDIQRLPPFDGATAHRLYTELLAPVKNGWQGSQHLIVASGGSLSRLPFGLLLTSQPTAKGNAGIANEGYRNWPWLIRDMAISQLPAASSLLTLRQMKPGAINRMAFVGFGDPDFQGYDTAAAVNPMQVASARRLRNLALARPSQQVTEQGKPADWMDYAKIPSLPDTRAEILALAQALMADPDKDVFLGSQASKANLEKLDLTKRRVVAFATHGLLAGDFPGVDQPALALANPGGGKNGLLTLDDVLGLKLDADLVVLSACNTAGGDGEGGEAVSGLGRGFFYAGSRALLVTHWPVETVSAKQLVVGIFDVLGKDAGIGRAEALRQSMLATMARNDQQDGVRFSYAHPLFWAPYALVGDGGK